MRRDPIHNVDKLVSHVDSCVLDLDHPPGLGTAVKLYLGSDADQTRRETMNKRRQKLKKKLLDYY